MEPNSVLIALATNIAMAFFRRTTWSRAQTEIFLTALAGVFGALDLWLGGKLTLNDPTAIYQSLLVIYAQARIYYELGLRYVPVTKKIAEMNPYKLLSGKNGMLTSLQQAETVADRLRSQGATPGPYDPSQFTDAMGQFGATLNQLALRFQGNYLTEEQAKAEVEKLKQTNPAFAGLIPPGFPGKPPA